MLGNLILDPLEAQSSSSVAAISAFGINAHPADGGNCTDTIGPTTSDIAKPKWLGFE